MATIQIFNRDGVRINELEATAPREWVLNGVTKCAWQMSLLDPKCTLANLEYGNMVLIDHPSLPDWVGFIDSDSSGGRIWSSGNTLKVMAISAEILFNYGDTPIAKLTGTAGDIFRQIIEIVNGQSLVAMVQPGDIYIGGQVREETLGQAPLEHIRRISERAGNDWDVRGEVVNGLLQLYANWYERKGTHYDRLLTEDHLEFSENLLEEQGEIVNDLTGYGDASTRGTRMYAHKEVTESIGQVGRRRRNVVFSGNTQQGTLEENTETMVGVMAWPRIRTNFSLVNEDDLYELIDVGNSFPYHLDHAGFQPNGEFGTDGTARILAMAFSDEAVNDKVQLVVEGEA